MLKKLFPLLGLVAVVAIPAFAQNNIPKTVSGPNTTARLSGLEADLARYLEIDDDDDDKMAAPGRPRIVGTKATGVKASVMVNTAAFSRKAFDLVNEKRKELGLTLLSWNDELANAATLHSQNMAEFNFFSHRGLDNKMVSDRADAAKVGKWRAIGENIAFNRGYADPVAKAVELWLDSPQHKRNMLSPDWKESAIGIAVNDEGAYYFTQVFLLKK